MRGLLSKLETPKAVENLGKQEYFNYSRGISVRATDFHDKLTYVVADGRVKLSSEVMLECQLNDSAFLYPVSLKFYPARVSN